MKFACKYAIVRFLPYVETGEFANIGIVLICPQTGYLGFKLLDRPRRINAFFSELDKAIFKSVKESFAKELIRLQKDIKTMVFDHVEQQQMIAMSQHLFSELIRPREAIIRFDEPRVILAGDPGKIIDELFSRYVERGFVTKSYQKKMVDKHIQQVLNQAHLEKIYRPHNLSNAAYHVNFPFVKMVNNKASRVIKPLDLTQEDPAKLYDYGLEWVIKIRKLKKEKLLPDAVLFAVNPPDESRFEQFDAYKQVREELVEDVVIINYDDKDNLLKFALEKELS